MYVKISKAFDFIPEENITEEYAYNHKGKYPVFTGSTDNNGISHYIDTWNTEGECITFTTYGSAGKIFYREGKCTIGRNCMGLKVKPEYKDKIIVEWFAYKFQNLFYRLRIGEIDGQKSLNKMLLDDVVVKIPDKETQSKELSRYKKANKLINIIDSYISLLIELKNLNINNVKNKHTDIIGNVFNIMGGNSSLTEKLVYVNKPTSIEMSVPILSSSTKESTRMGYIDKRAVLPNGNNIKIFEGPCILVARNGYAGNMTYIPPEKKFTINDHAYIFTLKEEWKNKVNLRWFTKAYQELFFNIVTSKSDNATFNKSYAEKQIVHIPDISEQNIVSEMIEFADKKLQMLKSIKCELENLIEYEII